MTLESEGPRDGTSQEMVEVDLRFDSMRDLHAELAPMLSNDGLFILSEDPQETDTVVRFRITLPEDFVLIEGTGVVIWSRSPSEEPGPAGMAVRYASLSREAQETIDAIIDAHLASGGSLFNLDPAGEPQASIPTDALDHESLDWARDRESAKAATARQLEQARLTIRDALQDTEDAGAGAAEGEPMDVIEDQYLASVEAQVEEAVAGIRENAGETAVGDGEPVDDEAASLSEVTEQQELEGLEAQATEPEPEIEAEEFEVPEVEIEVVETDFEVEVPDVEVPTEPVEPDVEAEPVQTEFVTAAAPSALERTLSEASSTLTTEPVDAPPIADEGGADVVETPATSEDAAPEGTETEVIESVIPVFLERWKEEIGAEEVERSADQPSEAPVPAVEQDTQPATSPEAPEAPRVAVDEPAEQPVLDAEPVAEPASGFEVSVVDEEPVRDDTPRRDPAADSAEVILAPPDSARPPGRRLMWLLLIVLIPLVGVGAYFGWDWYQGRSAPSALPDSAAVAQLEPELEPEEEPPPDTQLDQQLIEEPLAGRVEGESAVPVPEPTPVPPVQVLNEPATLVESIEWLVAGGATEVVIRGNGQISEEMVSVFPMRNPDRILVRLRRIEEQYRSHEIPVGSAEVLRIRTGHHPEQTPPALYVVLDLANPLAGVADYRADGDTLRVRVEAQ